MTESILEVEYKPGEELVLRLRPPRFFLASADAREHFKAARKEVLLGLRSFLDSAIEHLEKAEKEAKPHTKIEVE